VTADRPDSLDRISVVLVKTLQPGNIGSAARAMSNMGLRRLKLVEPREVLSSDCLKMAGHAAELITSAQVFPTLKAALAEENLAVGATSGRDRRARGRIWTPRELARLAREYAQTQKIALVFGSEKRGLSEEDLALCHYLVTIPSDPAYPVLNLAQAVMVLAYEIFNTEQTDLHQQFQLASHQEREQMFEHLERVLTEIGFLSSSNPGHIMRVIRRFLGRSDLTPRDINVVRGILSQIEWFATEGYKLPPERVRKP
jgi:TrmH family RNA methyltransferase